MPTTRTCPECGATLADDTPVGGCPVCAFRGALELSGTEAEAEVVVTEKPGDHIGRYKLLEKIGEGGCGIVYMAEQTEPIRRRVALKVIKLGMDTRQVVARFEAERQALALMDHPNIAKVLEAGATDTGRPYFVMELVKGVRITDYCDQNSLSTGERLGLFMQVCHAIQHAHQKGIIHRDIKPSNILVTLHDGVPVPKVIDFGIAKATSQQLLTDKTLFTALHQFVGTPAYMSPEQAELSGLDIDTRSDIYALGVLLYELLTGKMPFDAKDLLAAGMDEMRRVIREKEPPKPSARLSTLEIADLSTVAKCRQAAPPVLIHLVRGDLDWIVMKCLEKDRTRRYETANGLAMDLQRHVHDEPVMARPPSAFYRFRKMARRNKLAFAAATAVALALGLGIIGSTWQAVRATKAEQQANAARAEADLQRDKARQAQTEEATQRRSAEEAKAEAVLQLKLTQQEKEKAQQAHDRALAAEHEQGQLRKEAEAARKTLEVRSRGESHARAGQWKEASADFSELVELEPTNHWNWYQLAPLLVETGDLEGYRKHREAMLARFGTTNDPPIAERTVKVSLLLPAAGTDLVKASKLAETAVTVGKDSSLLAYFQFAKALAEYREGHFAAATGWARKALAEPGDYYREVHACMVLAMAQHQLNKREEANAAFANGKEVADTALPKLNSSDLGQRWYDVLITHILLREAKTIVGGDGSAGGKP
jgi:tetratricopeptide (TPR) repeat protein